MVKNWGIIVSHIAMVTYCNSTVIMNLNGILIHCENIPDIIMYDWTLMNSLNGRIGSKCNWVVWLLCQRFKVKVALIELMVNIIKTWFQNWYFSSSKTTYLLLSDATVNILKNIQIKDSRYWSMLSHKTTLCIHVPFFILSMYVNAKRMHVIWHLFFIDYF